MQFARTVRVDPLAATRDDVERWLARTARDGRQLAANTRVTNYNDLASFYTWAEDVELVDRSPMRRIKRPRGGKLQPKPVTTGQLEILLAAADETTRAQMTLAAYQGLRRHEVAKVRGEDIDLERGVLLVLGKGAKEAYLPLHDKVRELAERMPARGWWFPSAWGPGHEHPEAISAKVAKLMRANGIQKGAIHRLRHWFGTETHRATGDLLVTQRLMRHESPNSTQGYADVDAERLRAALIRLPALGVPRPPDGGPGAAAVAS